jgi:peptidoglycan L-alanyl-D-glutamate endopeptidase CwlK
MFNFSKNSLDKLEGVHQDLQDVAHLALELSLIDFGISEGTRKMCTQREFVRTGVSQTMNSRHLTGHAIDVFAYVGGQARWEWELYAEINKAFKKAAKILKVDITWGGSWTTFKDGPHYQLNWVSYPSRP